MVTKFHQIFTSLVASALLFASGAGVPAMAADASITILPTSVTISPPLSVGNLDSMLVRIMSPDDEMVVDERSDGGPVIWSSAGAADGSYRYEVYVLVTGVEAGNELHSRTSGTLRVANGMISQPSSEDSAGLSRKGPLTRLFAAVLEAIIAPAHAITFADPIESEGGTARVQFDDNSNNGSAPWLIDYFFWNGNAATANPGDFRLYARDFGTILMEFNDGGPNQSDTMEVDANGDIRLADDSFFFDKSLNTIGIGTTTPAVTGIHAFATSGKANMEFRLENTSESTWDFGQSEFGDFFFQIVANGNGGPTGTMMAISDNSGYVGIGTTAPTAPLEVTKTDGSSRVLVDENSATVADRTLFQIENNGRPHFGMLDSNSGALWDFLSGGAFFISRIGSGATEFTLGPNGDLVISGALTQNSSQANKAEINAVDSGAILAKVLELPIAEWSYKHDVNNGIRHVGPTAEDFSDAFGLGAGNKGISSIDTAGVALAAIQGLHKQNRDLRDRIDSKDGKIAALETELNDLKVLVQTLVAKDKVAAVGTMQ